MCYISRDREAVNSPGSHPGDRWFESNSRNHKFFEKGGSVEAITTTAGGMAAVMSAMDTVIDLSGKVWELMTSNPVLAVFVAASLIPGGVTIFVSIRNAARG